MKLFEILVPCQTNQGVPIRTRHHREWDRRVRRLTGGLTILSPSKGYWINPSGELFTERMIPVRIVTTDKIMSQITDMTAKFYEQEAIMVAEITDKVTITEYPEYRQNEQETREVEKPVES